MRAVVTILAVASFAIPPRAADAAVPPDFRVVAIFGAGGLSAPAGDGTTSIVLTITADGGVSLKSGEYYRHDQRISTRVETSRISSPRLDGIMTLIQRNRFFSLPPDMGGAEDSLHYVLTITADGRTLRVDVTPPFDKISELRRFRTIWISVLKTMPSPLGRLATKHLQKYI